MTIDTTVTPGAIDPSIFDDRISGIPLLDHGYLRLITKWGSEEEIVESARMSTGKDFRGWGGVEVCPECKAAGRLSAHDHLYLTSEHAVEARNCKTCKGEGRKPGDEKLLRHLWTNEHGTPFEMAGATFEVQAPIMVFREWHRHRVPFGYNELSARYTPLPDFNYSPSVERIVSGARNAGRNKQAQAVAPVEIDDKLAEAWLADLQHAYAVCETVYQNGLRVGVPKELARLIVPVGRYSRMRATGNLRGWLAFLKLRQAPNAQYEIRVFAAAVHDVLAREFPRTLALFDESANR